MRILLLLLLAATAFTASSQDFPTRPGTVTHTGELSWDIPNTRADGTPLPASELAGYEIYLFDRDAPDTSLQVIDVPGGNVSVYRFDNLALGNWAISLSAYDTDGLYSERSSDINFTISGGTAPRPPSRIDIFIGKIIALLKNVFSVFG